MIKNIVFFKSPKINSDNEIDDPYYQNFKNDGYNTEFIKVLVIDYNYDNLKYLYDNGSDIEYFGIIFTSSNSIKSIDSFLSSFSKENNNCKYDQETQFFINNKLKFKNIYIIGETSCNLFIKVFGKYISQNLIVVESNATDLAKRITIDYNNNNQNENNNNNNNNNSNNNNNKKPLLYFCGNQRREELPTYLNNNNIQLKELITYQSQVSNDSINDILNLVKRVLQSNTIMEIYWLVFFSPSGVDFVMETIDNQLSTLSLSRTSFFNNKIKVAAIGKTTENSLKNYNIKVDIVSPFPNAQSLFSAISNYSSTE
ncbi:hypothetical protein ACTFIU_001570 [Dictyostelium citrinum]